jgi:glycosyltransferase involved in cell wall biosynthesis
MEGGVGAFTQELAKALAQLGHDVHIITSRQARPAIAERKISDLLQPVELGFARLYPVVRHWRWPSLAAVADVALRYELDVVNIQYQAAAFHMRSPAPNFLPWRLKGMVKTAVTFHDLRTPYLFPKAGQLRHKIIQLMARQAHGCIVTNEADYHSLVSSLPKQSDSVSKIPIGSNITTYKPTSEETAVIRQTLNLQEGDCLLGYFGFLNDSKGADTLLQVLAQLASHVHLVFIGGQTGSSDGDNNATFLDGLKQLVADLGLEQRVHWTGFVPDQQVSTYLHTADLIVMPYRDGVSLRRGTLMAVLAHGRPLITTQPATPTPELVHGQNCWLVPANDEGALAPAIEQLLAEPARRQSLGQNAAHLADLFTWDKIAVQTAAFYQQLLRPDTL